MSALKYYNPVTNHPNLFTSPGLCVILHTETKAEEHGLIRVIEQKKLGYALNKEEIIAFANAAADPATPDYQLAALRWPSASMAWTPGDG